LFLRGTYGGLTGIARYVILADLAGADRIWIAGDPPDRRDWEQSFRDRRRPLPEIIVLRDGDRLPPPALHERRMILPADALLTPAGVTALAAGRPAGDARYHGDDARSLTMAILRSTIKPTDGWVCRNINRPVSMRISARLLPTGIGPTPVTWFTLLLAAMMVWVLVHGSVWHIVLGGLLYQIVSTVDGVDGEIARSTYRFSARGALLDTICDMLANFGFAIGLMVGLIETYGASYVGYATAITGLLALGVGAMALLLRLGPRKGSFDVLRAALARRLEHWPRLRDAVLTVERLFKRDAYVLFGCVTCLAGLAWTLPPIIIGGLAIWNLAIAWCAPLIIADKDGELLPAHLRGA
jgi:CDP-L-myo-inositol myo-inositolphosphotransferase